MAKDEEAKDEAEATGGGKKKLIIIIVPIVLLLAGAGWFFFLKPKPSGVPEPLPHPVAGAVVKLDSITVNLAGGHFLKFGMALQPTATAHEVDGSEALDLAITLFSQKTLDELATAKGKREAKEELVARIKLTYLPHDTVLSEVTSTAATTEKQTEEETKAKTDHEKEASGAKSTEAAAEHELKVEDMTAAEAIKRAESLTVQADIYDLYFTEFVMQ